MVNIHPMACVDPAAHIGADVEIGPFAVVAAGVRIGDGCRIGPHAVVFGGVRLGARCAVHAGAVVGDTPQDLSFRGVESFVEIGDDCTIREGVTIHRGTKEGTATRVGPRCYLMANAHLAHNVRLGERVILANGALLAGYVEVGDFAFISGNAGVHQFCRIGRLAMVGGVSALTKDCPPFCIAKTGALNRVTGLNVIGLRRAGFDAATRLRIKEAYALVYQSGLNVRQALAAIRSRFTDGPPIEFADFIEQSARGICSGLRPGEEDAENAGDASEPGK